ncbi:MAG TPA: glycerophosphodiester phosphodiesterase [Candidatus Kapabacteria bacterium]|nr:glycerophosphodiester phosphodiesterase [Candidatus Kapabacteria bacterium]
MLPLKDYPFAARPMIVAHRGDTSFGAAGNSVEAIVSALISGADMIEVDVQWSADEEFVCYHDEGHPSMPEPIYLSTFRELKAHGVASLVEILTLGKGKIYFNLEIKEYSARDPRRFMHALIHLLTELGLDAEVLLSSFRPDYLREAGWTIPTCIIHPDEAMRELFTFRAYSEPIVLDRPLASYLPFELMEISHATGYACQIFELTPDALADIEKRNIFLGVYTITSELEFDEAVARGARALVCENPRGFAGLRNKRFPAMETMPRA